MPYSRNIFLLPVLYKPKLSPSITFIKLSALAIHKKRKKGIRMLNIVSTNNRNVSLKIINMKKFHSTQFGVMLRTLRQQRGLSQQTLAEFADVERNYIYYLEKGLSDPTLGVLIGLANGLGLNFSEFAEKIETVISIRKL